MKHTPGPWYLALAGDGSDPQVIADCDPNDLMAVESYPEKHKNARLIAAAPELLEALKDCVRQITALCSADDVPDSARAAIVKATGRGRESAKGIREEKGVVSRSGRIYRG